MFFQITQIKNLFRHEYLLIFDAANFFYAQFDCEKMRNVDKILRQINIFSKMLIRRIKNFTFFL